MTKGSRVHLSCATARPKEGSIPEPPGDRGHETGMYLLIRSNSTLSGWVACADAICVPKILLRTLRSQQPAVPDELARAVVRFFRDFIAQMRTF